MVCIYSKSKEIVYDTILYIIGSVISSAGVNPALSFINCT